MCLSDLESDHPKVDVKREKNQKLLVKDQTFEATLTQQTRSDRSSCAGCGEKLQVSATFGEKSVLAVSSLLTKGLLGERKSWSLGGKLPTEPENNSTLCKIHGKPSKGSGVGLPPEEKQVPAAPAEEKPRHEVSVFLGLTDCPGAKRPERLRAECQGHTEGPGASCCREGDGCLGDSDVCGLRCCHPSNLVVEAPGQMSDTEWMSIFKPAKLQRVVRHRSACTCAEGAGGPTRYHSARLVRRVREHPGAAGRAAPSASAGGQGVRQPVCSGRGFLPLQTEPDSRAEPVPGTASGAEVPLENKGRCRGGWANVFCLKTNKRGPSCCSGAFLAPGRLG